MRRRTSARTRLTALITTIGLTFAGVAFTVVAAPTASADPGPVIERASDLVTTDSLPTAQIDGVVWSQVIVGNTVYVGGSFANARPAGSAPGVNTTPRSNLMAYNLTTGILTPFAPVLDAQVQALAASPDGTKLYVVGDFTTVNGITRNHVAVFNTADGTLNPININIATRVKAVTATSNTIYVGGLFTAANGQPRNRLAAFDASNGALLAWNPNADDNVNALVVTPGGSKVIVGGAFQNVGGQPEYGLAAVDPVDGSPLTWDANQKVRDAGANSAITSLSTDGTSIFGTGFVFGAGGNLEGTFKADPTSGAIQWIEDCHGDTYAAYSTGKVVYTVSHAHYCGNIGGFPQSDPWSTNQRRALAFTIDPAGTINHDPLGYFDWFGNPSPSLVNWYPNLVLGTYTGQGQAAWTVTGNSQYVVMGGEFPTVNGLGQQGLARFAVKSISGAKVGPNFVTGLKFTPNLITQAPGSVRISFQANADQDDVNLTYKIVRNSLVNSPIYTTTVASTYWNRPNIGYVDTGLTPGAQYRYRLYVTDPDGNQVAGDTVTYTVPDSAVQGTYAQTVVSQGAGTYWRMDEPSGSALVDWVGFNDGVASAGVTRGMAGAINGDADTASTFNGTSTGMAMTRAPVKGPDTYSTEAWINTTTTTGGRILGFSNLPAGNSNFTDRVAYMDNAGRIWSGVYNGAIRTLNTTKSFSDGQWHQIVTTLGPDGMTLYVDGLRAAKRTDVTSGRVGDGYWRLGGDTLNGWTSKPTSNYFNGSIDELSIYPGVLTKDQVLAQYVASGRTSPLPPAPADAYGAAVYSDQPDLYYRLGETTGTVANDTSASINTGTYFGTSTKGVSGAINGVADTAVTFNGTNGSAASNASFTNPTTYSEEAWFKTNTTRGGKIIGFGSSASGLSSSYDRHVYMQNDGKVVFGAYTGVQNIVVSPVSYNNNQWHHVVATQGSDGMKLYLDGQLVGSNAVTGAQNYTGFWRIGGDRTWNSTSSYFAGSIDEAAVYPTVLTAARVIQHYKASGRTLTNVPPAAAFTTGTNGLIVTADGSTSSDLDGTVASYSWNFGDSGTGTGVNPSHTYAAPGTYSVALTVTDNDGGTNTLSHAVTVTNNPPVAAFTSSANDLALTVDGSSSSDPDGSVTSYAWNFGDSGTATGVNPTHMYANPGDYTVTLTVTDNAGGTATKASVVSVRGANSPPTAAFTTSATLLALSVDGSTSADPDGSVTSYAWSFGDGATGTGATATHTYATGGTYTVALTVTDDRGGTNTTSQPVTVNRPPVAAFTSSATALVATFDGTGSSDPDAGDSVATYAWDFGDSATGNVAQPSHTYTAAGTYPVKLTVTDSHGASTSITKSVSVVNTGTVVTDTFTRSATSGWGTSDFGGAWTLAGTAALFSANGTVGTMRLASAGAGPMATLSGVSAADVSGSVDIAMDKLPTGSGSQGIAYVRRVPGTGTTVSDYRIKLRLLPTSTSIQISRIVNNVDTPLVTQTVTGITYQVGDVIRLSFQANGTAPATISAKAWKVGTTEPTAWRATATDSDPALQGSGAVGLQAYLSGSTTNAPVVASFDNVSLTAATP